MSGLICQTLGGGGICRHPGRENNNDPKRVYGDVLKVFRSNFPEVGVVKVPCYKECCLWACGFLLAYTPVQFRECLCLIMQQSLVSRW